MGGNFLKYGPDLDISKPNDKPGNNWAQTPILRALSLLVGKCLKPFISCLRVQLCMIWIMCTDSSSGLKLDSPVNICIDISNSPIHKFRVSNVVSERREGREHVPSSLKELQGPHFLIRPLSLPGDRCSFLLPSFSPSELEQSPGPLFKHEVSLPRREAGFFRLSTADV